MRDFSGKGSLWCINPEFRPQILDAVRQLNPTSDINKISSIAYFQDVLESQKTTSLSPNNNHLLAGNSSPTISRSTMSQSKGVNFKRSHSALNQSQLPGAIINPKIVASLNTNRRAFVDPSSMPLDLSMNSQKMRNLMANSNSSGKNLNNMDARRANLLLKNISKSLSFIEQSGGAGSTQDGSELDAVNALLSMKSNSARPSSSSTILNPLLFKNSNLMRHKPSAESSSSSSNMPSTSASAHQSKADTKSRRKQILKPPTKKVVEVEKKQINYEEDFDDQEDDLMDGDEEDDEFRMLEEEEEVESGEVHNEFRWSNQAASASSSTNKLKRPAESHNASSNKKSKKLLVKLPCFKAKKSAHVDINHDDDDVGDDEPEEGELRSRSDEEAARYRLQQQQHQQVVDLAHLASLKAINALLELSRAAKIIEEQKQLKAASSKSSKDGSNKK